MSAFSCRSCGSSQIRPIIDLGRTPLANALLTEAQLNAEETRYPLEVVFCGDCSLVQITETVPPEVLFSQYLYLSSFSATAVREAAQLAQRLIRTRGLDASSLVMEIASNDGYLLQHYRQAGIRVLGVEPARNVADFAREQRGIETLCAFFGLGLALELSDRGTQASIVHANNVLAHVADLNGFVEGITYVLGDGGWAVIEVPYVRDMIEQCEFDTIYHEHLCYFSLHALRALFSRHGLRIIDIERLPIHGGSLRVYLGHERTRHPQSSAVPALLADEVAAGIADIRFYLHFGERIERLKRDVVSLLTDLKTRGKSIAVYGASAKGSTLLNCFEIGSELLDFVVDRSTLKQGRYTPGTHLPIHSPEKLVEAMPDYTLLLTWNFAQEILDQHAAYRQRGGKFIVPIPDLRIL